MRSATAPVGEKQAEIDLSYVLQTARSYLIQSNVIDRHV